MSYSKTITADAASQVSILSTARGLVTVRIYFNTTSREIDLNPIQLAALQDAITEAQEDTQCRSLGTKALPTC